MATSLYGKGRNAFLEGTLVWSSADVRAILTDAGAYTVVIDTDDFLNDVAAGARIGVSAASIAGKAAVLGVADATDHTIASVSGVQFEAIVLYYHTGNEATSNLLAYIDNYTGLPTTPNGGDITIAWPNDANKIFKL